MGTDIIQKSTQMLVFRSGVWHDIDVNLSDPIFTEGHRREAAAMMASLIEKDVSLVSARAEAEKTLYSRLYSILRKEHCSPENKKE